MCFIQNCSVTSPSGYPAGGWVGQPKSREGQLNQPPSITKQRPDTHPYFEGGGTQKTMFGEGFRLVGVGFGA